MSKKVVIIGNGVAGITCARYIRKMSNHHITVISSETPYFFSRTALMYIYMGHMKLEHTQPYENGFWQKNKINLLHQEVASISPHSNTLSLANGQTVEYDDLVIATGSQSNFFNWPGQQAKGVQGLYNLQDLANMEQYTQGITHAVVVGGGLIGIETVEMLQSRNIKVSFLVREKSFWDMVLPPQESQMINRHIAEHHVDLQLGTELKEIISDENGRAKAIITSQGNTIPCSFVAITVGVSPNITLAKNAGIACDKGVLVNQNLQTNFSNIYACGDCTQMQTPPTGRRPIEPVWYTGKMQGQAVASNICGHTQPYAPGHWFNSAKFFDIEYQTYGLMPAAKPDGHQWHYWQDGQAKRAIRLLWHEKTGAFKALNAFGIRIRHEVCNQWLVNETPINEVVKQLRKANFDPEFFKAYEKAFTQSFNEIKPTALV